TSNEMWSRTCLPSKPIDTSLKTTMGSSSPSWWIGLLDSTRAFIGLAPEDADHQAADQKVHDDDEDRRNYHRLRGRAAHALGSSGGAQPVVAADRGDDEAREHGLGKALPPVALPQ